MEKFQFSTSAPPTDSATATLPRGAQHTTCADNYNKRYLQLSGNHSVCWDFIEAGENDGIVCRFSTRRRSETVIGNALLEEDVDLFSGNAKHRPEISNLLPRAVVVFLEKLET